MSIGPLRILLVEADPADVESARARLLESEGERFEITVASSLGGAQRILGAGGVDLVVLDLDLPDAEGIEGVRRLRGRFPEVPIVVLTDESGESRAAEALAAGAQDYVTRGEATAALLWRAVRYALERHSAQLALERLSRRYELLLDSAGEGILGLDTEGRITFANPAAQRLLGRSEDECLGSTLGEIVAGASSPLTAALSAGESFHGEIEFRRPGGETFPSAATFTLVEEGSRKLGGVLVFEDISARRREEERLRASEARYRELVRHAPYGLYWSTPDGRFLMVNEALVRILGYDSVEEVLALDMARDLYFDPEVRRVLVREHSGDDRIATMELTWRRKDGSPVAVRVSGRPVRNEEGDVEFFEMLVEDVSARRSLEEQLRQAQKMEAVGQLTGGIAHDFNNVLAAIQLNTEMIAAAVTAGEAVEMEDVEAIRTAAQRASAITKKLLGFSRKADLELALLDVNEVVGEFLPVLRAVIPESVELAFTPSPRKATVLADQSSLEQIVLNLVTNARDAMPEGGRLRIEVREASVRAAEAALHPGLHPGRFVCLEVSDTGVGMDAETVSRIFDPFFSTKESGSGTGLGMAMVYGLTKQQNGYVRVESEPGQGTAVRLFFPLRHEAPEALRFFRATAGSAGAAVGGGRGLLVVEDEGPLRSTVAQALERHGYRVWTAPDARAALDLFARHRGRVDLVLTDIVLPGGMSGVDLVHRIFERYGPTRFLLASGYAGDHVTQRNRLHPAIPFLKKPWTLNTLLATVQATLEAPPPPTALRTTPPGATKPGGEEEADDAHGLDH